MSERFSVLETPLAGVRILERQIRADERGSLERMYDAVELEGILGPRAILQVNRTLTRERASIRGMHYQMAPSAETKIVSCLRGAIFDVAVDLRRGSPTFLQWHGETLDVEGHRSLIVPEGCAHGYQSLVDDSELLYFHTAAYDPASEGGAHALDPRLGIIWPLPVGRLSQRDASFPMLGPGYEGIDG